MDELIFFFIVKMTKEIFKNDFSRKYSTNIGWNLTLHMTYVTSQNPAYIIRQMPELAETQALFGFPQFHPAPQGWWINKVKKKISSQKTELIR